MLKKNMILTIMMIMTLTASTSMRLRELTINEALTYKTNIEKDGKLIPEYYDIVVYGGGLQAVAAATKAAGNGPELSVALIVPYPLQELGGIATTGGQNYWDVRTYKGTLYQGGSFAWWYNNFSIGYNVQEFSDYLKETVSGYGNITTFYLSDIRKITLSEDSKVESARIGSIYRNQSGYIAWDETEEDTLITGNIFIDASEDCKLLRLSDNELDSESSILTVGRYDWPSEYLTSEEIESEGVGIQASATLMFKVSGVVAGEYSDMFFSENAVWGGNRTFDNNSVIEQFNDVYGPEGYAIKSINASRDGQNSDEWWINAFLIFNVDARAAQRDAGTENYPIDMLPNALNTDLAWAKGRAFLSEHLAEIENVLHQFDGFGNVEVVLGEDGNPVVGDVLYIRESVHLTKNPDIIDNGTENVNYAVTADQSLHAGTAEEGGADAQNYDTRIGIGFYFTDIHPYEHTDRMPGINMRPDIMGLDRFKACPAYIPYEALVTTEIPNLIAAGYGSSISSVAWGELRVFGNLCVMGDAAGVAAAYCSTNDLEPANISIQDVNMIQNILLNRGAILDK